MSGLTFVTTLISGGLFGIINNFILITFTSLSCGVFSLVGGSVIGLRFSFFFATICSGSSLICCCRTINHSLRSVFNRSISGITNCFSDLFMSFCSLTAVFSRTSLLLIISDYRSGGLSLSLGNNRGLSRSVYWLFSNSLHSFSGCGLRSYCLYCRLCFSWSRWLWRCSCCLWRYCISCHS